MLKLIVAKQEKKVGRSKDVRIVRTPVSFVAESFVTHALNSYTQSNKNEKQTYEVADLPVYNTQAEFDERVTKATKDEIRAKVMAKLAKFSAEELAAAGITATA